MLADIQNAISQFQGVTVVQKDVTPNLSRVDESIGAKIESIPEVRVAVPQIMSFANSVEGRGFSYEEFATSQCCCSIE